MPVRIDQVVHHIQHITERPGDYFRRLGGILDDELPDGHVFDVAIEKTIWDFVAGIELCTLPENRQPPNHRVPGVIGVTASGFSSATFNGNQGVFEPPLGGYGHPQSISGAFYDSEPAVCTPITRARAEAMLRHHESTARDMVDAVVREEALVAAREFDKLNKARKCPGDTSHELSEAIRREDAEALRKPPANLQPIETPRPPAPVAPPQAPVAPRTDYYGPPRDLNTSFAHPAGSYTLTNVPNRHTQQQPVLKNKHLQRVKAQMRNEPVLVSRNPPAVSPLSPFTRAGILRPGVPSPSLEAKLAPEDKPSRGRSTVTAETPGDQHLPVPDASTTAGYGGIDVEDSAAVPLRMNLHNDDNASRKFGVSAHTDVDTNGISDHKDNITSNDDSGIALDDDTTMFDDDDSSTNMSNHHNTRTSLGDNHTTPPGAQVDVFNKLSQDSTYGSQEQDLASPPSSTPDSDPHSLPPANRKKAVPVPVPAASRRSMRIKTKTAAQDSQPTPPPALGKRGRRGDDGNEDDDGTTKVERQAKRGKN
ncbi:hypothetical protein FB567DRAFT_620416 [Paraphoma chrysanthemicola]|uniref:Uncharacterized protein n=1 Tax=Paraphoma chrysanthemicola TaxID=798071 RepID=A0A8K0R6G7_9PLEO|nr:hypothetical protein FB567DRAFT_620416 [Paraphoma chrysanthemicola]